MQGKNSNHYQAIALRPTVTETKIFPLLTFIWHLINLAQNPNLSS